MDEPEDLAYKVWAERGRLTLAEMAELPISEQIRAASGKDPRHLHAVE